MRRRRPPADYREHGREQLVSFILDRFKKFQIVGRRLSHKSPPHDSECSLTTGAVSRTLYGRPAILRQERRSWTSLRANCKEKCKDPGHQFSEQTANGFASKADPMRPMNTIPLTTVGRRLVDR